MRKSPAGYDRAIFLLLDGARDDVFHQLLAHGDMPICRATSSSAAR
jgi:hypothetical protein